VRRAIALIAAIVLLLTASVALAKRAATPSERTAVVHALGRSFYGGYLPVRCSRVYISTANRTWASETFFNAHGCLKYGTDGITILHVEHGRWHPVTAGSAFRCPIVSYAHQPRVPAAAAHDLLHYVNCA
jgi:hypothetical protein